MHPNHTFIRSRSKLLPTNDGPPIRRDAIRRGNTPIDTEDHDDDGSPVFERVPIMQFSVSAFHKMMDYLTAYEPERAVALLGPKDHDAVTHVLIDDTGDSRPASFTLGHVMMNLHLEHYTTAGIDVKGIAHSHPRGCHWPSYGDLLYVSKCFAADEAGDQSRFLLPIVVADRIFPYIVFRNKLSTAQSAQIVLF